MFPNIVIHKYTVMCVKLKIVGKLLLEGMSAVIIPNREFSDFFLSFDMITKVSNGPICALFYNMLHKPKKLLAKKPQSLDASRL